MPETIAPALPLSHQHHPVWAFLGNFSLALLKLAAVEAPAVAPLITSDPKAQAGIRLGAEAAQGLAEVFQNGQVNGQHGQQ